MQLLQKWPEIDREMEKKIDYKYIHGCRYIDRAATLFCPCTKDYIFAPMDDDRPC